jgi:hypothetical protein
MVRPPAVAALLLLFGEAAAETAAESAARLDPRSHVITNASQVLNYEIEGVSLNTAPGLTESILAGRGYRRVYPAEPPKVGHTNLREGTPSRPGGRSMRLFNNAATALKC